MSLSDKLEKLLQPGTNAQMYFGENHTSNLGFEVRSVVDDEVVVYRFWDDEKERWRYKIDPVTLFERLLQDGQILIDEKA